MGLTDFNYPLQTLNPMTGSMNFDPLAYGLTMQDIKDSASDTLKTSFTGGNISITDNLIEEVRDLSRRKYSTVIMPENMDDKASGLYLNNERMGFWDRPSSSWTAYIDSTGNFELRHPTISDSSLTWNSALGTLTIQGDITGSTITGSTFKTSNNPTRIEISNDEIRGYDDNGFGVGVLVSTIKPGSFVGSTGTVNGTQITGNLSVSGETVLNYLRLNSYIDQRSTGVSSSLIRRTNAGASSPALVVESIGGGSGAKFRTTSSDINDYDLETAEDIAIGPSNSNARIYLGQPGPMNMGYIWNDGGVLTWNDGFGTDHPLH